MTLVWSIRTEAGEPHQLSIIGRLTLGSLVPPSSRLRRRDERPQL